MSAYKWKPVEPLSVEDRKVDTTELQPLYDSWRSVKERLRAQNPQSLTRFTDRLVRSLSVETGILERLYDLDRGTTEALILHGFTEELVSRSSTDIEPSLLIDILRDQEAAVHLVMDVVANNREVTKSFIHQLHTILTKHQKTTRGVDQSGNRVEIPLLKGKYKEHPNNPTRPDGSVHEYCPPIHVESEMERLLALLAQYEKEDPILTASWLHHRFTQIHPYQDGNGRVARALITLVLLKADLLPLVIDRDLRTNYISALEKADNGKLKDLFDIFASLEKKAILQALSVDVDQEVARDQRITKAVIDSLAAKFRRRHEAKETELRRVNDVALALRSRTHTIVERSFRDFGRSISFFTQPEVYILDGGSDRQTEHWYRREVVETAKQLGKWVNFDENHYFVKSTIRLANVRLVFVVSLHHIGQELSGIMEASAFAFLEFYETPDERVPRSEKFFPCSLESFVITWNSDPQGVQTAFDRWLDAGLAVAMKEWGDHI